MSYRLNTKDGNKVQGKMALLDLDGTLVDSVPDLAFCADEMMKAIGEPTHGEAKVRNWVGNGVERLVKRALTNSMHDDPSDELLAKALPIFMDVYKENTSKRSQVYPGVVEGLEYLKKLGLRLGCVTNKAAAFTEPLLRDLRLSPWFEIIISGDTLPKKKPDPMPLLHAAELLNVTPQESIMVGDSVNDVKAARAAGFQVVCVSYGYNHGLDIRDAHPDAVMDSLAEIEHLVVK